MKRHFGLSQDPAEQFPVYGHSCYLPVAGTVMPETRSDRRKRHCARASSPQQHVHPPWLKLDTYDCDDSEQHGKRLPLSEETMMPVADGRNREYCEWWRAHCTGRDKLGVFSVRLIGDASSPELFTSIAHNDLAYSRYACRYTLSVNWKASLKKTGICSKWGGSRVVEHQATGAPIILCFQYSPGQMWCNKL